MYKRILITGDAGRGKTTFAQTLSRKTGIPLYSTDDFFWKVKFTEANDRTRSEEEINKVYEKSEWIMEGTTRRLIHESLGRADIIYLLEFTNIIPQYYFLIRRSFSRKHERIIDLWRLLRHVTYKKYKKGYGNHLPPLREMLKPYNKKVIVLSSIKEINAALNSKNNLSDTPNPSTLGPLGKTC